MEFGVLGPLQVCQQGQPVVIGTPRTRAVLGLLLAAPSRLVSVEQLVDELWPNQPPLDARALVHGYVSRLRRALRQGPAGQSAARRVITRKPGYLLRVDELELDLHRFERLVADARTARQAGDQQRCVTLLRQAHRQWRGAPFADVPATPTIAAAAVRLDELRLTTLEEQFAAALDTGHEATLGTDLVAELTELVTAYPLRERLVAQLMLALHRAGRTADALATYQQAAQRLADELGIDPGPELVELQLAILRGQADPAATGPQPTGPPIRPRPAGPPWPVPAQLPADLPTFTGRAAELARLDTILAAADPQPAGTQPLGPRAAAVVISAVSGTAGIGKTTLAVHWAHRVASRFPDGQLYVNLRGFSRDGSALSPAEAVRGFLDALHVPVHGIPASLEAQAAKYRSLLAGRQMLVVLDNARDAEQVRPLLPGAAGCLVLVTSRNQLSGLVATDGAHPVTLDLLSPAEARELLARRLGEHRVAAEPDAVGQIIAACARLPIALAVVAARAAAHPGFPLAALATELTDTRGDGLDALAGDDPATDVRTVFSWSYRTLSDGAARLFRLLGVHPGPDIGLAAVASLAGAPAQQVRPLLTELAQAHLLTEHAPGRYACHDLLRAYATELAGTHDTGKLRHAALRRVLDHYLHSAYTANRLLSPHRDPITMAPPRPGVTPEVVSTRDAALSWFTAEHPVLVGAVQRAASAGFDSHTWRLAWCLVSFFDRRGHWRNWAATQQAAVAAARRLGDLPGQAQAHRGLARADLGLGRLDDAHSHLRHAVDLFTELGDDSGRARTHLDIGIVLERQGRYREGLRHDRQALALFRSLGHRAGQAAALNATGLQLVHLGDLQRALDYCRQALELVRALGEQFAEAAILDSLGYVHHSLGQHQQAASRYRQALALCRGFNDRYHEAHTLVRLGDTHQAAGEPDAAMAAWLPALEILDDLDHPDAARVRDKLDALDRCRTARAGTPPSEPSGQGSLK